MKIIDDVKRDLRFLIESKLNKEKAVQTVAKLYEKERLNQTLSHYGTTKYVKIFQVTYVIQKILNYLILRSQ